MALEDLVGHVITSYPIRRKSAQMLFLGGGKYNNIVNYSLMPPPCGM